MAVHRARSQPHKSLKIPQIVGVKFPLSIFAGGVDHGVFRVCVVWWGCQTAAFTMPEVLLFADWRQYPTKQFVYLFFFFLVYETILSSVAQKCLL